VFDRRPNQQSSQRQPVSGASGRSQTSGLRLVRRRVTVALALAGCAVALCTSASRPGVATASVTYQRGELGLNSAWNLATGAASLSSAANALESVQLADAAPAAVASRQFSPAVRAKLAAAVAAAMRATSAPGAIVGVWQGTRSWLTASGVSNLATGAPMRLEDQFRIASNTKAVVATAVLRLVDEHRIGLDDPISRYVQDVPDGSRITIRELLQHTSGLADYYTASFNAEVLADPLRVYTPAELLTLGFAQPPAFRPPGSGWAYSNTGYVLLGEVLTHVTHEPLQAVLERQIFSPLGLDHTRLALTPALPRPNAHGYIAIGPDGHQIDITQTSPTIAGAAGAITSNLADVRRLAVAIGDGTLLTRATQLQRLRAVHIPGAPSYVGYGLGVFRLNDFVGHDGEFPGYISVMMRSPTHDTTIVLVLTDSTAGADAALSLFAHLSKIIIPGEPWLNTTNS
jgi:D-alanyl-D-alanine carboxypeptidase